MPQATDLVGLGFPPQVADELGHQASAVTCAGTTQATATPALTKNVTLTAASSLTGVIIRSTAAIGTPHYFSNPSATGALVYTPVGSTLNGAASTVPLTLAQNKAAILIQTARGVWVSIPSP